MKKNILIYALGGKGWMGGIYYIKNLLFQLWITTTPSVISKRYCYYLYAEPDIMDEFSELMETMEIVPIEYNGLPQQLLCVCTEHKIDVVLPICGGGYTWVVRDLCLYWIPDFQDVYFPENFSRDDLEERARIRGYMAERHKGLMLSSQDAYMDYKNLYPENLDGVFLVHFVSCVSLALERITDKFEAEVLEKYGIGYNYIFISNQFWKHKNYMVVLEAMERMIHTQSEKVHLVCTGYMQSYGEEDDYVTSLMKFIEEHGLQDYIHFLGMLERKEQLCLMKNARLLIQPSKFEGWGCSVEDAKAMGKEILLSDIGVHKEQLYPKATIFPKEDSEALASLMIDKFQKAERYDLEYGRKYMMEKAFQYAEELRRAIDSMGIGRRENYLSKLNRCREEKVRELFGDLLPGEICIYGVGKCTVEMLKDCIKTLGERKFAYSDSDAGKWGMEFGGGKVYPPSELLGLGIKRVVISSLKYQDEIYESIKELEKEMEIIKVYQSERERNEPLWL